MFLLTQSALRQTSAACARSSGVLDGQQGKMQDHACKASPARIECEQRQLLFSEFATQQDNIDRFRVQAGESVQQGCRPAGNPELVRVEETMRGPAAEDIFAAYQQNAALPSSPAPSGGNIDAVGPLCLHQVLARTALPRRYCSRIQSVSLSAISLRALRTASTYLRANS
jgi:hypothetical protein